MLKSTGSRWAVISILILFVAYKLWPTYKFYSLTEEDKTQLETDNPVGLKNLGEDAINLGLDLQGGMHVVLEVDIPNLVKKLANNKTPELIAAVDDAEKLSIQNRSDFFDEFTKISDEKTLPLKRSFTNLISTTGNTAVIDELKNQTDNSINSVLEIIRNRVDEFGVAEPNIQKSGTRRIIVELAGVKDPERARNLIQSTALLEFILVKDAQAQQAIFTSIDDILIEKGVTLDNGDSNENPNTDSDFSADTTSDVLAELFDSENEVDEIDESNPLKTPGDILNERPFSGYLKAFPTGLGVLADEFNKVSNLLANEAVKKVIPFDSKFLWGSKVNNAELNDGSFVSYRNLYFVNKTPELTGGVIKEASATFGAAGSDVSGQAVVNLTMNSMGTKKWSQSTGANVGRNVAIVLDGKVYLAPVIRDRIPSGRTQITGLDNVDEAKDIANVLRAGALPTPVNIIEERTVGPSLGRDSINSGTSAMIIGFSLVIAFMVLYYRGSGFLAIFALILNIVVVLSVLAGLNATLTLPGIAGLILTIGMAVDANVIIFERIREEIDKGKTVRASIDAGYQRAFTTILDANLTTLIAAFVLWGIGSGPIKGFAITLSIGICSSMFTAIFVTRTFFMYLTNRKTMKSLSI